MTKGGEGPTTAVTAAVVVGVAAAAFAAGWALAERRQTRKVAAGGKDGRRGARQGKGFVARDELPDSEKLLLEEQLSRGAQFLGEDGQLKVDGAFVVVVGVGGVGSHCAHFLARSGVRRLRIVDFDNVTLSSLNRHAVAGRADVGTPKVEALARHIREFAPYCEVDCRAEMFTAPRAEALLEGEPDYVVDCIDDRNTKVELLAHCLLKGLRVLSSMAAGAKADPSRLHFTEMREVVRDPLASRLRWSLRKYLKDTGASADVADAFDRVEVLYSSELPHMKLLPLDSEVANEDPAELGAVPNFRVRVMPVLGTMPAVFGIAMAARVVTELAGRPFSPIPAPFLKQSAAHKYRQKLVNRLAQMAAARAAASSAEEGHTAGDKQVDWTDADFVGDDDVATVVAQFCQRCPVSQHRMGAGQNFELALWRFDRPVRPDNLVLCATKAVSRLEALALAGELPTPRGLGISQEAFAQIVHKLAAMRTEDQSHALREGETAFARSLKRALPHMNKDHQADNLTLVRAFGGLEDAESATMVSLDRFGAAFRCKRAKGGEAAARVLFPSELIEAAELRETLVKLTLQGRTLLARPDSSSPPAV